MMPSEVIQPPIFVRTRHVYGSYTDYWRLVELSGFETCYVDEIDFDSDRLHIISPINGEVRPIVLAAVASATGRRCRLVWWCLERPDEPGSKTTIPQILDELLGDKIIDEGWVADRHFASYDPRFKHVVLGSHPALVTWDDQILERYLQTTCDWRLHEQPSGFAYDFAHMSYRASRREEPYQRLCREGLREAPTGWAAARDAMLRSTKIMLNVHQTPAPIGEPLRFALAAAYGVPLLTETLADPYPLVSGVDFIEAPLAQLTVRANELVADGQKRALLRASLYERLCHEWTFRRGIEHALVKMHAQVSREAV